MKNSWRIAGWFPVLLFAPFLGAVNGCGSNRDVDPLVADTTRSSLLTPEKEQPVEAFKARAQTRGIIRDYSMRGDCGFLIEVEFMGNKALYQPELLDEKFKEDGLSVTFTYTRSRRPVTCENATPIILDSIE